MATDLQARLRAHAGRQIDDNLNYIQTADGLMSEAADHLAAKDAALRTARSQVVALGGNPHPHDMNADQIQIAVLAAIDAALNGRNVDG